MLRHRAFAMQRSPALAACQKQHADGCLDAEEGGMNTWAGILLKPDAYLSKVGERF